MAELSLTVIEELDVMLADIAQAVERARAFQREHGLVDVSTRKLPSTVLHNLERWRRRNREHNRTMLYADSQSQPHGTASAAVHTADTDHVTLSDR